jgi:D-glycero-alpha-D-manno-heptose 1-phosphate guanylyltransferase
MAPVGTRPFLAWLLERWIAEGIERLVLSVGYKAEAVQRYFGTRFGGVPVHYAYEATPLGTGGGLLLAARELADREPFLVVNGDTSFPVSLAALDSFSESRQADWCFALFRAPEADRFGRMLVGEDGSVAALRTGAAAVGELANGGVYRVAGRHVLPMHRAGASLSLEDDLVAQLLADGRSVCGMESDAAFLDIGLPADYARAASFFGAEHATVKR